MVLQFAVSGADGAIGSTYNIIGQEANTLYDAVQNSNLEKARGLQKQMNEVIAQLEELGVYQTIKHVLKNYGIDAGYMKFPFKELTEEERKQAEKIADIIPSGKQTM